MVNVNSNVQCKLSHSKLNQKHLHEDFQEATSLFHHNMEELYSSKPGRYLLSNLQLQHTPGEQIVIIKTTYGLSCNLVNKGNLVHKFS